MPDLDELLPRDEHGFYHMSFLSGAAWAFAPSSEVERGHVYLYKDGATVTALLRDVPLDEGFSLFLMSVEDFEDLVAKIASGRIRPEPMH